MKCPRKRSPNTRNAWKWNQPNPINRRHRQIRMRRMPTRTGNQVREPTGRTREYGDRIDLMQIRRYSPPNQRQCQSETRTWKCDQPNPNQPNAIGQSQCPNATRTGLIEVSRRDPRGQPAEHAEMRRNPNRPLRTSRMPIECTTRIGQMRRILIT